MMKSFNWRHVLALGVLVCLISVVAGAAMAQEEPELPEPEGLPVGEPAAPAGPNEAPVMEPLTLDLGPAVVSEAPTNLQPTGLIGTVPTELSWNPAPGSTSSVVQIFETTAPISEIDGLTPLTSTTVTGGSVSLTPTAGTIAPATLDLNFAGLTLRDGFRYVWRVAGVDGDGAGPFATTEFTINVPAITPTSSSIVYDAQPTIQWPVLSGVGAYTIVAYVPSGAFSTDGTDTDAITTQVTVQASAICDAVECAYTPLNPLWQRIAGDATLNNRGIGILGSGQVDIYIQALDASGNVIQPDSIGFPEVGTTDYFLLTGFTLQAPGTIAEVNSGFDTYPYFSIDRDEFIIDRNQFGPLGTTVTAAPDFYRLFFEPTSDGVIVDTATFPFIDGWWTVRTNSNDQCIDLAGNVTETCLLSPPVSAPLYDGTYNVYLQGFYNETSTYTPWTNAQSITIANGQPPAESMILAGTYDRVGNPFDVRNPDPTAMTSTWRPCSSQPGGPVVSNPQCTVFTPLVHFAVNGGPTASTPDTGPWVNILIYNATTNTVVDDTWVNIYQNNRVVENPLPTDGSTGRISGNASGDNLICNTNLGNGAFPFYSCVYQSDILLNSDASGDGTPDSYHWYMRSYNAGGFSTGGPYPTAPGWIGGPETAFGTFTISPGAQVRPEGE